VWFGTVAGPVLAWQVEAEVADTERYLAIVDATRGRVMWRSNQVRFDDVEGQGLAWGYYPSDLMPPAGGTQQPVTFPVADETALSGNNAHVWKAPFGRRDEVPANGPGPSWTFPAVLDTTTTTGLHCSPHWACTWDSRVPYSWRTNMRMASTQLYYFLNTFHDHLLAPPIGFTEAAGNFQLVNESGEGLGDDAIGGLAELGAGVNHGLPGGFAWNAFFSGGPDGQRANVYMLMFPANYVNHIAPSSDSAIDASVVYHEYTHGLSTRLVFYADGSAALNYFDAYAMGEAWSDWYALDFLEAQGHITDTAAPGEIVTGYFIQGGRAQPVRSEPMDCPVGSTDPICPGGETGHTGGYTLGDLGHVAGYPGPHADGEIWSQTLWDLRTELGVERTEMVVTRAMELSPPDPSFLDMRNAILLADRIAYHGDHRDRIWQVFAARGMGYFASESATTFDVVEDFSLPPVCPDECGKLHGTVTDSVTGQPLPGVLVEVPGAERFVDVTDGTGAYTIRQIPLHTYPGIETSLGRYEPGLTDEVAVTGDTTVDIQMHRDWAARSAGASIVSATGRAFGPRYNASRAIDLRLDRSWVTYFFHRDKTHRAEIVIDLGRPIDVSGFGVAPIEFRNANLRRFTIQTRTFHGPWVTAAVQEDALPGGSISTVETLAVAEHVRFVRVLLLPRRNAYLSGLTEFSVRGEPSL
jgi:extracellular elastinolytic metalloproteinase